MHVVFCWENQNRPLGKPRHRWEGNTKIELREKGGGGLE
jgi:hypothetical protein